ncbi:hypothetical protein HNQ72_005144 [Rhizobium wenxiniae]|uniref:Uncharacterized protein n=1 Tax=Rhizobium wenxiniae TaxID=1737357 RepID=A0A7X0D2Q2_9HYPH|nr:hypothetical protein [Rhizobium wenxiniae]
MLGGYRPISGCDVFVRARGELRAGTLAGGNNQLDHIAATD